MKSAPLFKYCKVENEVTRLVRWEVAEQVKVLLPARGPEASRSGPGTHMVEGEPVLAFMCAA